MADRSLKHRQQFVSLFHHRLLSIFEASSNFNHLSEINLQYGATSNDGEDMEEIF
jgi:hypothetical protein